MFYYVFFFIKSLGNCSEARAMQYIVVQKGKGGAGGKYIQKCFITDVQFLYHSKKYSINISSSLNAHRSSPFHEAHKKATHLLRLFYTCLSW